MKNAIVKPNRINRRLPAIVAVGSGLAAFPAAALELGEVTVQSRLGQPLRASIAYALAPNEQIANYCVTMRPGPSLSGLPGFGSAQLSVANGVIMLTGKTPVREPMISAHVVVNCPYSANLSREYLLFIDPLTPAYDQPIVTQQSAPVAVPVAVSAEAIAAPVASVQTPVSKDIAASTRYQVLQGETLSDIASRIQNRPIGLWPAVNAIFAANPAAFIENDPNKLKAGSWLAIPDFGGNAAVIANEEATSISSNAATYAAPEVSPVEPATDTSLSSDAAFGSEPVILDELTEADASVSALQPGDIILNTELEGPTTNSTSPNVPTAIISPNSSKITATPTWLFWLAGSGVALILGLLMFGRRLRGQTGTAPSAPQVDQQHRRRFSDTESTDTENVEAIGVDYDLSDDSPTEENLVLDADLIIGTGLETGTSRNDSQDFGFAATTNLDIELPFEPVASASDETDMLPPLRTDEHSILDSEVLPEDDYDMSVIIDATKMPQPEEVTERDLKAVEVVPDDETLIAQNYTINKEVDYQVIEQDYEDEFTATQALNIEIARAAEDLATQVSDGSNDDMTAALPLASVTELDITAQMPAQNDDITDPDETGINEEITVNTPADDETVEMPVESGKAS